MQVKTITLPYTRSDVFHIYPFGDMHMGTKHCVENQIVKKRNEIRNDPLAYWIDMGDSGEFITPSDPRWDWGSIEDWVHPNNIATDLENHYCDVVSPIKDKCLGKLKGNHEVSIELHSHINVQKNICDKLGIADLGYSCFIKFRFVRKTDRKVWVGFFTHGAGNCITAGAKLMRLQRLMDSFEADIVASGHIHDIVTYTKPYLSLNNRNEITARVKVGAITGCWFRSYTQNVSASYAERKNYPPTTLGCPRFVINPDKDYLAVEN